jgi:hypothetical protein
MGDIVYVVFRQGQKETAHILGVFDSRDAAERESAELARKCENQKFFFQAATKNRIELGTVSGLPD